MGKVQDRNSRFVMAYGKHQQYFQYALVLVGSIIFSVFKKSG